MAGGREILWTLDRTTITGRIAEGTVSFVYPVPSVVALGQQTKAATDCNGSQGTIARKMGHNE